MQSAAKRGHKSMESLEVAAKLPLNWDKTSARGAAERSLGPHTRPPSDRKRGKPLAQPHDSPAVRRLRPMMRGGSSNPDPGLDPRNGARLDAKPSHQVRRGQRLCLILGRASREEPLDMALHAGLRARLRYKPESHCVPRHNRRPKRIKEGLCVETMTTGDCRSDCHGARRNSSVRLRAGAKSPLIGTISLHPQGLCRL